MYYTYIKSEFKEHDKEFFIMKNLEKKPFEECKIELIELGDSITLTDSYWKSEGGGEYNKPETGEPMPGQ